MTDKEALLALRLIMRAQDEILINPSKPFYLDYSKARFDDFNSFTRKALIHLIGKLAAETKDEEPSEEYKQRDWRGLFGL